jgi:hypothetical protein
MGFTLKSLWVAFSAEFCFYLDLLSNFLEIRGAAFIELNGISFKLFKGLSLPEEGIILIPLLPSVIMVKGST